MRRLLTILIYFLVFSGSASGDAYVIFYATGQGQTGHCGIAIDEYKITSVALVINGQTRYSYDSIKTGALVYYDLWPSIDEYKASYDKDVAPRYFKLPGQKYKQWISVKTLAQTGIPHKLGYACDGLVSFTCTAKRNFELRYFLDRLQQVNKPFNAVRYNCCDFVCNGLAFLLDTEIEGKEWVFSEFVSTPNALYRIISQKKDAIILKDPGNKAEKSFVQGRILEKAVPFLRVFF